MHIFVDGVFYFHSKLKGTSHHSAGCIFFEYVTIQFLTIVSRFDCTFLVQLVLSRFCANPVLP